MIALSVCGGGLLCDYGLWEWRIIVVKATGMATAESAGLSPTIIYSLIATMA